MKFLSKSTVITVLCIALAVASFGVLPGLAQDTTVQNADTTTIVTGAVSFGADGSIIVAGITIAPAGAFNPSNLKEGDLVVITGVMLNETTLQATSFEFFEDDQQPEATPEATMEMTPEATMEMTPEATYEMTPEATVEMTAEPTEVAGGCNQPNQPVAMKIAATFNVSYDEVMALHCDGNGFGEIVRAYALAAASTDGATAADFLARHQQGEGWGQIVRESGVNPSDLAPGRVLKEHGNDDSSATATPEANTSTKPGNGNGGGNGGNGNGNGGGNGGGNGNGHGNGGNGGGNGNGNGGGNGGNGNGNGGGNGNGNGGGKGHGG